MQNILWIAAFGAVGAVSRYAVSGAMHVWLGTRFPVGTLTVNVLGCFLLGLLMHLGQATTAVPDALKPALSIGLLGALTTFSTFGFETIKLMEDSQFGLAAANVAANVMVGLLAVWLGLVAGRALVGAA